jgi:holo-[acyl-carrier protein] synthase
MVSGIGIDLHSVGRMASQLAQPGNGCRDALFTSQEIAYCESTRYPPVHYAARFAAKEALLKALGPLGPGARFLDIEILRDAAGAPICRLTGETARIATARKVKVLVSLTHTREWAAALVILQETQLSDSEG